MSRPTVSNLGGAMYGDGDVVVDFEGAGSMHAPLAATVLCPSGQAYSVSFPHGTRPSVKLAGSVIERVRGLELEPR
jgi:hypothetical protein